mmetsp:Transcript_8660/g.16351  ORF Transcript_8660/g.16351 Transcript_8660/m.16351 type:complete len:162 (+) Transcript_8660:888-1373(+)
MLQEKGQAHLAKSEKKWGLSTSRRRRSDDDECWEVLINDSLIDQGYQAKSHQEMISTASESGDSTEGGSPSSSSIMRCVSLTTTTTNDSEESDASSSSSFEAVANVSHANNLKRNIHMMANEKGEIKKQNHNNHAFLTIPNKSSSNKSQFETNHSLPQEIT